MRKWMNLLESVAEELIAPARREYQSPQEELAAIRAELASFKARHDELIRNFKAPDFDSRKKQFIDDVGDRWSDLVGREWELMKQLGEMGNRKTLKEFFA